MYLCVHCVRRTHPGQGPSRHRGYVCSVLTVACGTLLLADLLTHVLTLFYSLRCQGCLESSAFNHDPSANHPGECTGVITGCLDSRSLNFYPGAMVIHHPLDMDRTMPAPTSPDPTVAPAATQRILALTLTLAYLVLAIALALTTTLTRCQHR